MSFLGFAGILAAFAVVLAVPDSVPILPLQLVQGAPGGQRVVLQHGPPGGQRVVLGHGIPDGQKVLLEQPKPYQFGYESGDAFGTRQHRRESSDVSGAVTGSYGYLDPFGMYRNVEYTADAGGYRATVRSNEPGMASKNVADAAYFVEAPPPAVVAQGLAYLSNQLNPKILV